MGGGWYSTSVFFRLMVRPKALDASEKWFTRCCRAASVWARSAQSSANNSSQYYYEKIPFNWFNFVYFHGLLEMA